MIDDPDETEGRRLYRAHADKLAAGQVAMAKRRVKMTVLDAIADKVLRYCPKPKSQPARKRQRNRRKIERANG